MKKILSVLLVLAMLLSFAACGTQNNQGNNNQQSNEPQTNHVKPGAGPDYVIGSMTDGLWIDNYDDQAYTSTMDQIYISYKGFENLSKALDEFNEEMYNIYRQSFTDGRAFLDENPEMDVSNLPLTRVSSFSVTRNDSAVFCIMDTTDEYMGGPHGNIVISGNNFDTQTGKKLSLTDVITDKNQLAELVVKDIKENYANDAENGFFDYWEATVCSQLDGDFQNWCMTTEGLQIIFNTYELAPHAAGTIFVDILEKDNPKLFAEAYYPPNEAIKTASTDPYKKATDLYYGIAIGIENNFSNILPYDQVKAVVEPFVKSGNYEEPEYVEPWSTESSGEITIKDKDNDCTLTIFFWPNIDENAEFEYGGPVHPNELWYRNESYCAYTSYTYDTEKATTVHALIDYERYERISFDSADDLAKVFFDRIAK